MYVCLCVLLDTVVLCVKHHFQFQQEEWKAVTLFSRHHRLKNTSIRRDCIILPPSTPSHLYSPLVHPTLADKGSREAEIKRVGKRDIKRITALVLRIR